MTKNLGKKYLRLRHNTWYFQVGIPAQLQEHFEGKKLYYKSLQTSDLMDAMAKRDVLFQEIQATFRSLAYNRETSRFRTIVREIQGLRDVARTDEEKDDVEAYLEGKYEPQAALDKGDTATVDAYIHLKGGKVEGYGMSLEEAQDLWRNNEEQSSSMAYKTDRAVKLFVDWYKSNPELKAIDKKTVKRWVKKRITESSKSTIQGQLTALSNLWKMAEDMEKVDGANPFVGHTVKSKIKRGDYQIFNSDELSTLLKECNPQLKKVIYYSLLMGTRIGELTSVTEADFMVEGDHHFIQIQDGKTENARRRIPLLKDEWEQLKADIQSGELTYGRMKEQELAYSRLFSRTKKKAFGDEATATKSLHSLRAMTITAYHQSGVDEILTANIVGHSRRAATLSFGLYSDGYSIEQLTQGYQQMRQGSLMTSWLEILDQAA